MNAIRTCFYNVDITIGNADVIIAANTMFIIARYSKCTCTAEYQLSFAKKCCFLILCTTAVRAAIYQSVIGTGQHIDRYFFS